MKYLLFISFFLLVWDKYNRIAEMNALKDEAAIYYEKGEYKNGVKLYEKLINQYGEKDERLKLNLANSYFQLSLYTKATVHYKALINSTDSTVKSVAYLQLGVINSRNKKKELGLMYFREALKASSGNEAARYNYELLKKEQVQNKNPEDVSSDKKKENSNGANQTGASDSEELKKSKASKKNNSESNQGEEEENYGDTENTGGEDEEEENSINENGDKEADALISRRLQEVHMNKQQAEAILKAMQNSEIHYIQQRKKGATSKPLLDKPDW